MLIFKKILLGIAGIAFLCGSLVMILKRGKLYAFVEGYRDRNPLLRTLNPLARLNTPNLSRINAIFVGIVMLLIGVLLLVASIFGQEV